MRNKALLEQGLEGRLAAAMEQGEFEAYYQPKVDMDTGRIAGCEALVRWNHPEQGLLMPGSFIPFFEKKGLIVRVDLHMFELVCRAVRRWLDDGLSVVTVSCNFSQMHFGHAGFVRQVSEIADRFLAGAAPKAEGGCPQTGPQLCVCRTSGNTGADCH